MRALSCFIIMPYADQFPSANFTFLIHTGPVTHAMVKRWLSMSSKEEKK